MKRQGYVRDDGVGVVPLTRGKVALVDAADIHLVAPWNWRASYSGRKWYAARSVRRPNGGGKGQVYMHRVLAPGTLCDHVNGDSLDNRRSNLRAADVVTNARNSSPHKDGTSRFKGVSLHRPTGKWLAQLWSGSGKAYIGLFGTESLAARAYDSAARHHFGVFARTNAMLGLYTDD